MGKESNTRGIFHWAVLAGALALLNFSLTFDNVWPTLAIQASGDLSVELAGCVIAFAVAHRFFGPVPVKAIRSLATVWVLLVIGRYTEVTSKSLYGREINLYWDLRLMPDVGAMFAFVAHPWLLALLVFALLATPIAIYAPLRWAIGYLNRSVADPRNRRALTVMAGGVLVLSLVERFDADTLPLPTFAAPVTAAYAREARELLYEMSGAGIRTLPAAPRLASDLSRLGEADVFLIFMESYGAVSWQRPDLVEGLEASRESLDADIRETGRQVVSGLVESPTFGGESWLAHISLLSGTEVRDQDTNVRLMAQKERDTLVKLFSRHGYRTVGLMPGIQRNWPEGMFYGFDRIYGFTDLGYDGPPFGWWDITDQYALAKLEKIEMSREPRAPMLVVFPTISTHAPFTPAPPYQPDWDRILTPKPHEDAVLEAAWSDQADWMNLSPSYVKALAYANATLGGYLRVRQDRDTVMVLVGDHQPPALVSGEGASWDVPVHVIASRPELLERLRQWGFHEGLSPGQTRISTLHGLSAILLDAFGD